MDTPVETRTPQGSESAKPPIALIAGPTASGKSALALALAERTNGVIINADASQVYADLAILSARPSSTEMAKATHQLYGYIDGSESCSAARWASDAQRAVAQAHADGRLPILVGGTGLYIRTLLDGIAPVPDIDPDIRTTVRKMDTASAYAALASEDPVSAARLAPADSARVARALEVFRSTGRPLWHWHGMKQGGIIETVCLRPMLLLPPRDWLVSRCRDRFETMVLGGGIEEIEALLRRRLNPDLPVMRAIGVREIASFLRGEISREAMIERGFIATRQYVRRQYTWFAHQPPSDWERVEVELNNAALSDLVIKFQI